MKRKHWFASFILTWFFLQASAQSNAIFNEFKNAEHAKYTVISPYLTTLGKIFMGKSPDEKLEKKVILKTMCGDAWVASAQDMIPQSWD